MVFDALLNEKFGNINNYMYLCRHNLNNTIMAITNEQAQLLIGIEKKILIDNSPVDSVTL